ncbi:hypothetical protein FOCC_FOCC015299 [Frankliniella occidentalis]|nr:hypothetical protein FOCC_FOCC015299 [Frankliniella occidentalis]
MERFQTSKHLICILHSFLEAKWLNQAKSDSPDFMSYVQKSKNTCSVEEPKKSTKPIKHLTLGTMFQTLNKRLRLFSSDVKSGIDRRDFSISPPIILLPLGGFMRLLYEASL